MSLEASEFIQNANGSIYHLKLLPDQLAETIITVGDPDRVSAITKYFDEVELTVQRREFHTQTGRYKGKRISVVSTGIGTDNIDIVFNELDALVNIDFETRRIKDDLTSLNIIRIGTSGAIQSDIPVDSFIISKAAVGFDNLLHFYKSREFQDFDFSEALARHLIWPSNLGDPYVVEGSTDLMKWFPESQGYKPGITLTNCGFYGPQGRVLRLPVHDSELKSKLASFKFKENKITNLEMETSGMYGLGKLLNHHTVSLNAIIANRATGEFSRNPGETVDSLIKSALDCIAAGEF